MFEHYAHVKSASGKDIYKLFACKWESPSDPLVIKLATKQVGRNQWLFSIDGHVYC